MTNDYNQTLKKSIFLEEVVLAEELLVEGIFDRNTINTLIHGRVGLHYEMELLPDDWSVFHFDDADFIAHNDFLRIQDKFKVLEGGIAGSWESGLALALLRHYAKERKQSKRVQSRIYQLAYNQLSRKEQSKLDNIYYSTYKNKFPVENAQRFVVVGVPFYDDAQTVWEDFLGIHREMLRGLPDIQLSNGSGVLFASEKYRGDTPPCCDYFSYHSAKGGNDPVQMIDRICSHGRLLGINEFLPFLIGHFLGIPNDNHFSRSLLKVITNGGEETLLEKQVANQLIDVYNTNINEIEARWERDGHFFIRALLTVIKKRSISLQKSDELFGYVFFKLLRLLLASGDDFRQSTVESPQKMSIFINKLLKELNTSVDELAEG